MNKKLDIKLVTAFKNYIPWSIRQSNKTIIVMFEYPFNKVYCMHWQVYLYF